MHSVLWNVDPKDYLRKSADDVRDWFRRHPLRGGDLVLMHDRLQYAAEVVPELVETSRAAGLEFTTLAGVRTAPALPLASS
jgi:peptidoglycan/xylan/chitin deacetylase (PgdA/CDA1 family)